MPKIYYIQLNKSRKSKENLEFIKEKSINKVIGRDAKGDTFYYTLIALLFAKGSEYDCSVIFRNESPYRMLKDEVVIEGGLSRIIKEELELIGIFYKLKKDKKEKDTDLKGFFTNLVSYKPDVQKYEMDDENEKQNNEEINEVIERVHKLNINDQRENRTIARRESFKYDEAEDYICKAFLIDQKEKVQLYTVKFENVYLKSSKKTKKCSICRIEMPRITKKCYKCGETLSESKNNDPS